MVSVLTCFLECFDNDGWLTGVHSSSCNNAAVLVLTEVVFWHRWRTRQGTS